MSHFYKLGILFLSLLLVACSDTQDPPKTAPANVTVSAGENLVAVNWDSEPGLTYWIYYKQGTEVSKDDYDMILFSVTPPYLITGLENGTEYAVAVTSSRDSSPTGPFSVAQSAIPRLLSPSVPWTVGTSLTTDNLSSIAFGSNLYVTVGDSATVFFGEYSYISDNGVTAWNPPTTLPVTTTDLSSVEFTGSLFAALGTDGSTITSSDGDVWESKTAIPGAPVMNGLIFSGARYVAVGNGGAIYTNDTSDLSGDWTAQTSGTSNDLLAVSYVNNTYIALGELGTLLTSTDGITWIVQTSNTNNSLRQVAYGENLFVAIGDAGTIVSSADSTAWTVQTIPTTESFRSITYGPDDQFIAVGTNGVVAYSTTGTDSSWVTSNAGTIDLNSIAPNLVFIAAGDAGAHVSGK